MKRYLVILGTRPEAIKLAPIILQLKQSTNNKICVLNTKQHEDLCGIFLNYFSITPDIELKNTFESSKLDHKISVLLNNISSSVKADSYDYVIVQGDTISTYAGALYAFLNQIPILHIEAGLRSYSLGAPYPEEGLRAMISRIAYLNFTTTEQASENLIKEGVDTNKIHCIGNTVIDAISLIDSDSGSYAISKELLNKNNMVLVTFHRRENYLHYLPDFVDLCNFVSDYFKDLFFIIVVHPNPEINNFLNKNLTKKDNILLINNNLDYRNLIYCMKHSICVLTDSGGIQEEISVFNTPILIMRKLTERPEIIQSGQGVLVGLDLGLIKHYLSSIISGNYTFHTDNTLYKKNASHNFIKIMNQS